jgi:glycosyltransferase involved in cell wall biosynthesis
LSLPRADLYPPVTAGYPSGVPLVSVITPTQAVNADWIGDTFASLTSQVLPLGWEWEWLVQEDGPAPAVRGRLPEDERIRYAALGVQAGSPTTRNLALARARGDLVGGIDHDDRYADGGLGALVSALADDGDAGWACGQVRWLLPDGSTWQKPDLFAPGRVPAGAVGDYFRRTRDWPFPAAFALFRRVPLVAHGGWPALPRSDDAGLLAAYAEAWPGQWVARTVGCYRRWSGQKTVRPEDLALRHDVAEAMHLRLAALAACRAR